MQFCFMSSEISIVHVETHIQRPSNTFLSNPFVVVLSFIENHVCSSLAALGDFEYFTKNKQFSVLSDTILFDVF